MHKGLPKPALVRKSVFQALAVSALIICSSSQAQQGPQFSRPIFVPTLVPELAYLDPEYAGKSFMAVSTVGVADLNRDGKLDLVLGFVDFRKVSRSEAKIGVALGDGDGTFQTPVHYLLWRQPAYHGQTYSLTLTDVDGNGTLDIVSANFFSVSLMKGNGDGTFRSPTHFSPGYAVASPQWMETPYFFTDLLFGDFNGDGRNDALGFSNPSVAAVADAPSAFVLFKGTSGTLQFDRKVNLGPKFPQSWEDRAEYFFARKGDFNGDGKLDVAAINYDRWSTYHGNGDGTFEVGIDRIVPEGSLYPYWIEVTDVNGDNNDDILIGRNKGWPYTSVGAIDVMLGDGTGNPTSRIPNRVEAGPTTFAIADMNGDRNPDLISGSPNTITILAGKGDGTFKPVSYIRRLGFFPWRLAVGDFNGDGKPDIFATGEEGNRSLSAVLLNGVQLSRGIESGDFLFQNANGSLAFWQMAQSNFLGAVPVSANLDADWQALGLIDLNKDRQNEVLLQHRGNLFAGYLNGSTLITQPLASSAAIPRGTTFAGVGDFNGDGTQDILWKGGQNNFFAWIMSGKRMLYQLPVQTMWLSPQAKLVSVGDFNHDGHADLLWQQRDMLYVNFLVRGLYRYSALLNKGKPIVNWRVVAVADMNGDTSPDLLWQNVNGSLAAWLMNGTKRISAISLRDGKPVTAPWRLIGVN